MSEYNNPEIELIRKSKSKALKDMKEARRKYRTLNSERIAKESVLNQHWEKVEQARLEKDQIIEESELKWQDYHKKRKKTSAEIEELSQKINNLEELAQRYSFYSQEAYRDEEHEDAAFYSNKKEACWIESIRLQKERESLVNKQKSRQKPSINTKPAIDYYNRLNNEHNKLTKEYRQLKEKCNEAKETYLTKNKIFLSSKENLEKAIAAEELRWETVECMGCGSTFRLYEDWDFRPEYCKKCRKKWN